MEKQVKSFGIASMVLGILSLFIFGIILGTLAIIFATKNTNPSQKGFATAGLVTGIIGLVFGVILFLFIGSIWL